MWFAISSTNFFVVYVQDTLLAELLKIHPKWYVTHHEHDSLLVNQEEQTLTEDERKAAWDEYENEKKGIMARAARKYQKYLHYVVCHTTIKLLCF